MKKKLRIWMNRRSKMQIIALGFLCLIRFGTFLLMMPFSARSGEVTDFGDALFTATSATCVTGLVRVDTWAHWTVFGQIVILLLIQTGGLGFMTVSVLFSIVLKRKDRKSVV